METLAERLAADGCSSQAYHAGLADELRAKIQNDFLESNSAVFVATITFGKGIDKPNIRYLYHFNPPRSLEAYGQEIGRAGRDGTEAICEMLLNPVDRTTPDILSMYSLSNESDIRSLLVQTLLTYIESDGYLKSLTPRYDTITTACLFEGHPWPLHLRTSPVQCLCSWLPDQRQHLVSPEYVHCNAASGRNARTDSGCGG